MRHKWCEADCFLGNCVQECAVCGGWRSWEDDRSGCVQIFGADGSIAMLDGASAARRWHLQQGTPKSCPGMQIDFSTSKEEAANV